MRKRTSPWQLALGAMLIASAAQGQISGDVVRIGVLNDQSGPYVDLAGPGSVVAAQMAADEFAGKLGGARVEIVSADHQNKPDIGSTIVRRWFDEQGVDAVADVPTSSVALSVQEVARQKQRVFLISGAASEAMSGKACSPFSIHTSDDTHALTNGTVKAAVESGADTWFFITADYAFGHLIEAQSRRIVEAAGGKVLGSVKHPQNTADFAQYVVQAKASGAKAIGLANAGADTVNVIKQAGEFGIYAGGQRLVGLILFISEIHALGLKDAQGLLLTEGFYWDQNEATRTWSKAFQQKFGKVPTREQATTYATVKHYLKTIQAAKTDDAATVMKAMKAAPMELFGQTGPIRADGRFIYDLTLYQVKTPAESKGPWDYYKPIRTIAGKDAFVPADKSECPLAKAAN